MYFRNEYASDSPQSREQKLLDIYFPAKDYAKVVRLFLENNKRNDFQSKVDEIYATHASKKLGDTRLKNFEKLKKELQDILEEHLKF